MTGQDSFIATILAAPDDDLPRLVYADWLDEHGEPERACDECDGTGRRFGVRRHEPPNCPHCKLGVVPGNGCTERAEFIRVQCELAQLPACLTPSVGLTRAGKGLPCRECRPRNKPGCLPWCEVCERWNALRRRERELFAFNNIQQWFRDPGPVFDQHRLSRYQLDALQDAAMATGISVALFSRGFASHVTADLATLFGGPCRRCPEGTIWPATSCSECKGNRNYRNPGIAPQLFGSQPVTGVTLVGKEPQELGGEWLWFRDVASSYGIPEEIWVHFGPEFVPRTVYRLHADTRDAAFSALSAAATNLGRSLAAGRWHDAECGRCGGTEKVFGMDEDREGTPRPRYSDCPDCQGTGRVRRPGLLPIRG